MATSALFLHVTDAHLSEEAVSDQEELKQKVHGIDPTKRIDALATTLELLSDRLRDEDRKLDAILFGGDAQDKGLPGGHAQLAAVLMDKLKDVMHAHCRFVAVPGNHDIPQGSDPGSDVRYKEFVDTWRSPDVGAVTPWLDRIDPPDLAPDDFEKHRLTSSDRSWVIHPINTCNWSHTQAALPEKLGKALTQMETDLDSLDPVRGKALKDLLSEGIRAPIEKAYMFDIARVSGEQYAAIKPLFKQPKETARVPVRIALLHHHLLAPSLSEELRPYADVQNLAALRTYLRQNQIDVVIHGHKHIEAMTYDYIYDHDVQEPQEPRRVMVVSGGTLDGRAGDSSLRLVSLTGLPGAPQLEVERIALGRRGFDLKRKDRYSGRLWQTNSHVPGGPVVIHGSDIDDVYARAVRAANEEARMGMLIVHLDLAPPVLDEEGKLAQIPFPRSYPDPDTDALGPDLAQIALVNELAEWWQLSRSSLDQRIPYIHGTRLRRFSGRFDQVGRIVSLLKASADTSRAVAVLVDPIRDFSIDGRGENFASFCLVQFRRRSTNTNGNLLDCTAYYRAQEFRQWWPINVVELRKLQIEVANEINCGAGRITTIAADARAIAARSPGQVAIPIVDRWLDRDPARLVALAHRLCGGEATAGFENVTDDWRVYLDDQKKAALPEGFNPDGLPVAVNGLELLASYIRAQTSSDKDRSKKLVDRLNQLARENRNYESSSRSRIAFDDWSSRVRLICTELLELHDDIFGPECEDKAVPTGDAAVGEAGS